MMTDTQMTLDRFAELAEAYGGEISRWPEEDRKAAQACVARMPQAQDILAQARALDTLLALDPDPAPSEALLSRILGDAADVAAARAVAPAPRPQATLSRGWWRDLLGVSGWQPAGALAACLALGFVAGVYGGPDLAPALTVATDSDAGVLTEFALAGDAAEVEDMLFFGEVLL